MPVVLPSDAVLKLMQSVTNSEVLIVAPYIKSETLQKILAALPNEVSEICCITRWRPEDIATGVCDIEILEDITNRNGKLFAHPHLHAKYYRAGDRCLVGSANLTGRGLGWRTPANLELLIELPYDFPGLKAWELELMESSVLATPEMRDQIMQEAEQIKYDGITYGIPEVENGSESILPISHWVPTCPVPDRLWSVYNGGGMDTMVSSARQAALNDLSALAPPRGIKSQTLFEAFIAGILRQMPLIYEVDHLSKNGLTDREAQAILCENLQCEIDQTEQIWRLLKTWLVYFFPETYRLESSQDVLIKGKEIQR